MRIMYSYDRINCFLFLKILIISIYTVFLHHTRSIEWFNTCQFYNKQVNKLFLQIISVFTYHQLANICKFCCLYKLAKKSFIEYVA